MQLQNRCKKGARIFQKNTPKGGETWQFKWHLKWHLNDEEKMMTMIVDTLPVWKDGGLYTFKLYTFTDERIIVGLKRGKSDHHALINAKKKKN